MGISLSWGGDEALDESFEALLRSITLGSELAKSTFRSVSFDGRESKSTILKAWGSGKLIIQGSLSFNRRDMETFHHEKKFSVTSPRSQNKPKEKVETPKKPGRTRFSLSSEINIEIESPKHEAAVKLQKVYKSFRTRRQLADCAVLVEQRWWKLLDFALLKRSSVSFFDIERPESVISKWSRAKSRAAKVGKGLSKDEKAQKLALQHWLEAIDPRHRYGHNLHFYYDCWLRCESRQPFFYWLDVGEGKEVSIDEKCPRSKLQHQCIKYLGPKERQVYEVVVEDGKLLYKKSRELLDTSEGPMDTKWIFVLSTSKTLYVGQKKKGTFQHSSFLAGGATSAAGRLEVTNGVLKAVWPHSGHYRPTEENFQEFVNFLKENNVDLTDVKKSPIGEEEEVVTTGLRTSRSEVDLTRRNSEGTEAQSVNTSDGLATNVTTLKRSRSCDVFVEPCPASSLAKFKLKGDIRAKRMHINTKNSEEVDPKLNNSKLLECQATVAATAEDSTKSEGHSRSASDGPYIFRKPNLFVEEQESESTLVPSELILRRMNSKKGLKSLQLGQQLSFKWTTGAGPRIGCVRDYPSELQVRALEQVSLSPRGPGTSRFCNSPQNLNSPNSKLQEMKIQVIEQ